MSDLKPQSVMSHPLLLSASRHVINIEMLHSLALTGPSVLFFGAAADRSVVFFCVFVTSPLGSQPRQCDHDNSCMCGCKRDIIS